MGEQIEAVQNYLAAEFPGAEIKRRPKEDREHQHRRQHGLDFDHKCVQFRIDTGSVRHKLCADENFLDDSEPSTIADSLKRWEVARELRRSGEKTLLVGHEGLHLIEG